MHLTCATSISLHSARSMPASVSGAHQGLVLGVLSRPHGHSTSWSFQSTAVVAGGVNWEESINQVSAAHSALQHASQHTTALITIHCNTLYTALQHASQHTPALITALSSKHHLTLQQTSPHSPANITSLSSTHHITLRHSSQCTATIITLHTTALITMHCNTLHTALQHSPALITMRCSTHHNALQVSEALRQALGIQNVKKYVPGNKFIMTKVTDATVSVAADHLGCGLSCWCSGLSCWCSGLSWWCSG